MKGAEFARTDPLIGEPKGFGDAESRKAASGSLCMCPLPARRAAGGRGAGEAD